MTEANHNDTYTHNDQKISDLLDSMLFLIDDVSETYANYICPDLELGILRDFKTNAQEGPAKLSHIQRDVARQAVPMAKVLNGAIQLAECLLKESHDIAPMLERLKHALFLTESNPTSAAIAHSFGDACVLCAAAEMLLAARHPERNVLPYDSHDVFGRGISEEDRHSPAEIAWCHAVKYVFDMPFETVKDPDLCVPYLLAHDASKSGFDYTQEIEELRKDGDLPALKWASYGLAADCYGDAVDRLGFVDRAPHASCLYASIPNLLRVASWNDSEDSNVFVQVGSALAEWMGDHAFAAVLADGCLRIEIFTRENYLARLASLVGTRISVSTDGTDPDYNTWRELAHAARVTVFGEHLYVPSSLFARAGFVSPSSIALQTDPDRMSLVISPKMSS